MLVYVAYVGMIAVRRDVQKQKAKLEITTREVGRTMLARVESSTVWKKNSHTKPTTTTVAGLNSKLFIYSYTQGREYHSMKNSKNKLTIRLRYVP